MSAKKKFQGEGLPAPLAQLLDGEALPEKTGVAFLLTTVGGSGWPNVALLGAGELLAPTPRVIRLALWPDSRTTANLTGSGKATLFVVHDGAAFTVELAARRLADIRAGEATLACFSSQVEGGAEDRADYATLTSGVAFRLHDPDRALAHWQATILALKGLRDGS
jgi:hypothetical protein